MFRRRPKPIRLTTPEQIFDAVRLEILAPAEARDLLATPPARRHISAVTNVTPDVTNVTSPAPAPAPKEIDGQSFFDELATGFLASPFATGQGRHEALATLRGWLTVAGIDNLDDFYDAGGELWAARLKSASGRMKPGRFRNVARTADAFVNWLNDTNGHTDPDTERVDVLASAEGQSLEPPPDPRRQPHQGRGRGKLLLPENNGAVS